MKLYRYLLVYFRPALSQSWEQRKAEIGDIVVTIGPREEESGHPDRRLVTACIELGNLPERDDQLSILIPDQDRARCEAAAEHVANLISVLETGSKRIYSPIGCVALEPLDRDESDFLDSSQGIRAVQKTESAAGWNIEWSPEIAVALSDRMDGVAVLSEAFSVGGDSGMYREFVRFLELAFALSFYDKRLGRKLSQFLGQVGYGYDRNEINEWVKLRHPATHADLEKTNWVALTSDVRHVVLRMQQACLDVLFNKERWRDRSSSRRRVWVPDAFTTSKSGDLVVKQGSKKVHSLFRSYDEFGVYPRILNISVDHSKDGLYSRYFQEPGLRDQCL